MDALDFNRWQLKQRLAQLREETDFWRDQTRSDDTYRRHSSQVQAFASIIDTLCAEIAPTASEPVSDGADARERSRVVLALFRIWQFLRGKLVQRADARFRNFLWLADEYAWLCYKPIYEIGLRVPPLVFLNGGYSPFTLTRQEGFEAEYVPKELLQGKSLLEAMASLPFPVIGVPWYQIHDLTELAVIGHEVGHSVEADLKLDLPIKNAICSQVNDLLRQQRWNSWASELFADLYGCMSCGAAFVSTLAGFLSTERSNTANAGYPPPNLRFHFNLEVLRSLQDNIGAAKLEEKWKAKYAVLGEWAAFLPDAPQIAAAILDGVATGGKRVRNLIPFQEDSQYVPELIDAVQSLNDVHPGMPLRALVAAYRLAFDELMTVNAADTIEAVLPRLERLEDAMMDALKPDTRAGEVECSPGQLQLLVRKSADVWISVLR